MDLTEPTPRSSENFSLPDFLGDEGPSLADRVRPFSRYLRETKSLGKLTYSREITSPMAARVQVREANGTLRELVMMGSNNYLGLANHPRVARAAKEAIDRFGVGMAGPPLLNGMSSLHRELESALARLKHQEDALLFASGFQANLGWTTALLRAGDTLICDELHHASLFDGYRLSRSRHRAGLRIARHNDVDHLEALLATTSAKRAPGEQVFVAVEGVYSMDGDLAPLSELVPLCERYDATLVLDDAHGTGVMGESRGSGTAEHFGVAERIPISMGTFSKAFGVTGGFIAGPRELIDYLRYFSRSYLFSAHLPQPVVAAVLEGIGVIRDEPELRARLHANVADLCVKLRAAGIPARTESAIIPVPLSDAQDVRALGRRLHELGLFCNVIETPAVAASAQRIRLSVMATHEPADLELAAKALGAVWTALPEPESVSQ